jgi:SAM-dependent methyltransferase
MAINDDGQIALDAIVWRALISRWVTTTGGRCRPTSDCFDSELHRRETSGFLSSVDMVDHLREVIPQAYAFAGFPVHVLRSNGFGVERRPKECPSGYQGNASDHVVFGPIRDIGKKEYVRRSKSIVHDPRVSVHGISSDTKTPTRNGYDIIADEYYEARHITSRNFDDTTREYLAAHPALVPSHGLVLDLGCGRGRLSEYCGIPAARIVQADIAAKMLMLPQREPALGRVLADALTLPFKEGAFVAVGAFLFDPFNQPSLFEEVARVMARGAIFIGTIPHYDWGLALRSGQSNSLNEAVFALRTGESVTRVSALSPPEELDSRLTSAGFQIVAIEALSLPPDIRDVSPDIKAPAQRMQKSVYSVPIIQVVLAKRK